MSHKIEVEVKGMLADITGFESEEITLEMNIVKDLEVDSLKIIEIATAVEKKYQIIIKERQMTSIKTVGDIVNIVRELLDAKLNSLAKV